MAQSYKDLEVYKISLDLFLRTHRFTLKLPQYELHEIGSQLRRSSESINSNIVEGYGRKNYKKDFLRFLTYSRASHDETITHIYKVIQLYPSMIKEGEVLLKEYEVLGRRLFKFQAYVKANWKT